MSEPSFPEGLRLPSVFRYGAFYDLLADAVFQHRQAAKATDNYTINRFARASVLAATLSIECAANCLLATVDVPKALLGELDRMTPLGKVDVCLRLRGMSSIDYGTHAVQLVAELVKLRNDHVHPKSSTIPAEVSLPEDGDTHWLLPMSLDGELWPHLKFPKRPMFWSSECSRIALQAVADFYRYLFKTLMGIDDSDLQHMLSSRLEIGESAMVMAVFDEVRFELEGAKEWGVDFGFLGVFLPPGSAPLPPFRPRHPE
jgi:hypothetical protein